MERADHTVPWKANILLENRDQERIFRDHENGTCADDPQIIMSTMFIGL